MTPAHPTRIGPYRVIDLLGRGGLGSVYRAFDERTREVVAVKLLTDVPARDARSVLRLQREFEALALLDHPYVVRVFDSGFEGDLPWYAMELVDGVDIKRHVDLVGPDPLSTVSDERLPRAGVSAPPTASADASSIHAFDLDAWAEEPDSEILVRGSPDPALSDSAEVRGAVGPAPSVDIPYETLAVEVDPMDSPPPTPDVETLNRPMRILRIRELMAQVCSALAYIHSRGLVHRDLKPSNILVDAEGNARLMDFGLVKTLAVLDEIPEDGRAVGTYRYMSPEQAAGEPVDSRSDLYSVGVILYELLTGRPPFLATHPIDLWQELLESEPPPIRSLNPTVDRALARLAHWLLRKDPWDRPQVAEAVQDALLYEGV